MVYGQESKSLKIGKFIRHINIGNSYMENKELPTFEADDIAQHVIHTQSPVQPDKKYLKFEHVPYGSQGKVEKE